jgi:hypothetical protein
MSAENFILTSIHQIQQEVAYLSLSKSLANSKLFPEHSRNHQKNGSYLKLNAIAQQKKECQIKKA